MSRFTTYETKSPSCCLRKVEFLGIPRVFVKRGCRFTVEVSWHISEDLNPEPSDLESGALPIELLMYCARHNGPRTRTRSDVHQILARGSTHFVMIAAAASLLVVRQNQCKQRGSDAGLPLSVPPFLALAQARLRPPNAPPIF